MIRLFPEANRVQVCTPYRSLSEGMQLAGSHVQKRLTTSQPDEKLHALLDRIADEQSSLGG